MVKTYGTELEFADWNCVECTPKLEAIGAQRNLKELGIFNTSKVSVDYTLKTCIYGGEINSKPTDTIENQILHLQDIWKALDKLTTNHTTHLHLHIAIPGIKEDVKALQTLQKWCFKHQDYLVSLFEKDVINAGGKGKSLTREKGLRIRKFSNEKYQRGQNAKTPLEFYNSNFSLNKKGENINYTFARQFINIFQLWQTNTIEFRMFSQTDDLKLIKNAFEFCDACIEYAFKDKNPDFNDIKFPVGTPFNQELEEVAIQAKIHKFPTRTDYIKRINVLKEQLEKGLITEESLGIDFKALLKEYNI